MKGFLKGLLFGSLVGGTAGLFFAPRSGNETRKKLKKEIDEAAELNEALDESLKNFQESLTAVKQTAEELLVPFLDETDKAVRDFQFQAEPRIKQIEQQIEKLNQSF